MSLRRASEILDAIEVQECPAPLVLDSVRGDVAFDDVMVSFDRGAPAIEHVSFELRARPGRFAELFQ